MHNTTWIELSNRALRHNASVVRQLAPNAAILAMVKANGYGHGADWVAEQINDLVDGFAVARINEARLLRKARPNTRIVLLGTLLNSDLLMECATLGLDVVVHDLQSAKRLAETPLTSPVTVWLKLNVGMNRLGMSAHEFCNAHTLLSNTRHVADIHHMSHFSDAETNDIALTQKQSQALHTLSRSLGQYPLSMANSAAIIAHPAAHHNWVRPGIMLYGDDPTQRLSGAQTLKPVMTFKARIIALRDVAETEGVGYNRRWRAKAPSTIATVAAGYADGYPRSAPDGTPVLVNGRRAHLAGRVSMDLLTIDVSHVAKVAVGDEVTLWGKGLPAAEVAKHCGTISYELFTRITDRVDRVYR